MFFDAQAALTKLSGDDEPLATPATPATQKPKGSTRVAEVAGVATPPELTSDKSTPTSAVASYGYSVGGRLKTWTGKGKVVSLDEWRRLTQWERHGGAGKA